MTKIKVYFCLRCEREFTSKQKPKPKRCGKCKSPYWDIPRKTGKAKIT